jgi:hypothetical protein
MIPSVLMTQPAGVPVQVHPTPPLALVDIAKLTVQELAGLPAADLARLQREAESGLQKAKALVAWLEGALSLRYKDRAQQARAEQDKDTGTVRFEDNGVIVVADLPKRVKWDQQRLKDLVELIGSSWGEDPSDYVNVKFDVPERAYDAWPPRLKELFTPARTVETGKPSYELLGPDGRRA